MDIENRLAEIDFRQAGTETGQLSEYAYVLVVTRNHSDLSGIQRCVDFRSITMDELSADPDIYAEYEFCAVLDNAVDYDPLYLASMVDAIKANGADYSFVSTNHFEEGIDRRDQYTHTSALSPERTVFRTSTVPLGQVLQVEEFSPGGVGVVGPTFASGYGAYLRHVNSSDYIYRLTVIVPVYSNGEFLLSKCMSSLLRNDSWPLMRVLLVDDGSPDKETLDICQWLSEIFHNVSFYSFDDGCSGSASRPRNKGISLADTELLTFLDPDNEISVGGYDFLLETYDRLKSEGVDPDIVSGFQIKVSDDIKVTGRHSGPTERVIQDPKAHFFSKGKFPIISTQAAVIRTDFLKGSGILFVEKSAGQDTLFGWEVLAAAKNPTFVSGAHLIYYAERDGSVTNQIGVRYFEKCLVREQAQVVALRNLGILAEFKQYHFPKFMEGWYLKKLEQVSPEERWKAKLLVEEIANVYGIAYPI